MARVPVLEPRISPGIARDPGLNIPDNSGFLDEIGRAAEGVMDLSLRTQRAERSKAVSEAGFGLDADLKQFQLDHLDDPEPETLPKRFDDYFQSRQAVHEKALTDVDRQAFNARSSLAGQDFKIRVEERALFARNNRLKADLNGRLASIQDTYGITENPAERATLLEAGFARIDDLVESRTISEVEGERLRNGLLDNSMSNLAARTLETDPRNLLNIDDDPNFAPMDSDQRLAWKVKAQNEVDRLNKQAEQERKVQEREYLAGFDAFTGAIQNGVTVSPVLEAQYSDDKIEARVSDPGMRAVLKSSRDIAIASRNDRELVATMTPEQQAAFFADMKEDALTPVSTTDGATIATMKLQRLANLRTIIADVEKTRLTDPAYAAANTTGNVGEAWRSFSTEPTAENWTRYRASLSQTYADQGFYGPAQKVLGNVFARTMAETVNSDWSINPEQAADNLSNLAAATGGDWGRVFGELQGAGLSKEAAAIGFVAHDPRLQQRLVTAGRNGGMKTLEELVAKDRRDTIDDYLSSYMSEAIRQAGPANGDFMSKAVYASRSIAYILARDGMGPKDAARFAYDSVVEGNFTVVAEPRIEGMVPANFPEDSTIIGLGAKEWFDTQVGGYLNLTPETDPNNFAVTQTPEGDWVKAPRKFAGATVSPERAIQIARETGWQDRNLKEPLERFATEAEARGTLTGTEFVAGPLEIAPTLISAIGMEGVRPEDVIETARRIVSNSGFFTLSPDGRSAVLMSDELGLPVEVIGADGTPITVPIDELKRLGVLRELKDRDGREFAGAPKGKGGLGAIYEAGQKFDESRTDNQTPSPANDSPTSKGQMGRNIDPATVKGGERSR